MSGSNNPKASPDVMSVSELNLQARITIEKQFNVVWVEGELSNFSRPSSGHWYFSLKDKKAQVRCAMFAGRNRMAQIQPANGQQVLIKGRVSIYEGRGDFQIIVDQIEHAGEGALRKAFEELKVKLSSEGLFSEDAKRPLPKFPNHIAVVSSPTGAAVRDIIAVWTRRYPLLKVTLIPSAVQGSESEQQLVSAIRKANKIKPDLIILTRGGGSLEDLWSFNLESVAREISQSETPVISAVGHEIDFTISDFVADVRAPTPSAAAEIAVPDVSKITYQLADAEDYLTSAWLKIKKIFELTLENISLRLISPSTLINQAHQRTDDLTLRIRNAFRVSIQGKATRLESLQNQLRTLGPSARLRNSKLSLDNLETRLRRTMLQRHSQDDERLKTLARMLEGVSPLPTIARGYAVVQIQVSKEVVSDRGQLSRGQKLVTHISNTSFTSTVEEISDKSSLETIKK